MSSHPPVLFVCTGNICRSPVAEFLLRDALTGAVHPFSVSSAGTAGVSGHPMDSRSVSYLRSLNIDGSEFRARRLNSALLRNASLIVGFQQQHVDACLTMFPGAMSRCFLLTQLAQWHRTGALDTLDELPRKRPTLPPVTAQHDDPVGFRSISAYEKVLDAITADVRTLAALLSPGS